MVDPNASKDEAYESLDMTIGGEADEGGFALLPAGVYAATVTKVESERYEPGPNSKLPACWKVAVSMAADDGKGNSGTVADNLYCTKRQAWKIKNLFVACGLVRRSAESFQPDWKALFGRDLVIELATRKYRDRDGNEREANDVKRYLDPEDGQKAMLGADAAQPAAAQGGFSFPGGGN